MKIKPVIGSFQIMGLSIIMILCNCCIDDEPRNPYNDRTSAVFNPNLNYGTVTDVEGNVYKTIQIGTQTWMAENLRTTTYNDTTPIPIITDDTAWSQMTTLAGCCTYNNTLDIDTISTYGRLYNWAAVKTGKLAPKGWHVPTNNDWEILFAELKPIRDENGLRIEGGRLKETDTLHWLNPNVFATNSTGFTAIPAGGRFYWAEESFWGIGMQSIWWTSTSTSEYYVNTRYVSYKYGGIDYDAINLGNGSVGVSVRCVKDN